MGKFDDVFAVLFAFALQPAGQVADVAPFEFAGFAFFTGKQVVFVVDFFEQAVDEFARFAGFGLAR